MIEKRASMEFGKHITIDADGGDEWEDGTKGNPSGVDSEGLFGEKTTQTIRAGYR